MVVHAKVRRAPSSSGTDDMPAAVAVDDADGLAARRYDARDGTCVLIRPDQHVCARWRRFDVDAVRRALARATANLEEAA